MKKAKGELESELVRSYCNFCQSNELLITRTITVKCKKCGKTRVIQARL
jgi:Zn finger protein HypA/HybF involved in hydrogenase expression